MKDEESEGGSDENRTGLQRFDQLLTTVMVRYSSSLRLRQILAAATAVVAASTGPFAKYVGLVWSVVDLTLGGRGAALDAKRVVAQIDDLRRELRAADKDSVKVSFLKSDAGIDLFRELMESTVKVCDDRRRTALSRIFIAAASGRIPESLEPRSMLALIGELTDGEVALLGAIWEKYGSRDAELLLKHEWWKGLGLANLELDHSFLLTRLVGRGVLSERFRAGAGGYDMLEGTAVLSHIRFTDTGAAIAHELLSHAPPQAVVSPTDTPQ
jgi:hypothetical protein